MSNAVKQTVIFYGITGFLFLLALLDLYNCPIRFFYTIPCPGCGMTTAIKYILQGNLEAAVHSNLLILPFLSFAFVLTSILLVDLFFKKRYLTMFYQVLQTRAAISILFVLTVLSWLFNILHFLTII